ncbi:MAG: hypothetical protein AMXMBFR6_20330 [Betaproteobacteria bacterium]
MNFIMPNLYPASAEIFVLIMACVVLIVDLYCGKKLPGIAFVLTQATLVFGGVIVWLTADAHVALTFSKMFIDDLFGDFMKIAILATMAIAMTYGRSYLDDRGLNKGEFYLLALFATLGMMVIVSANHLLVLYIGLELMSLSLYAMVALRRDDAAASEAAMKYFVLGALASGFLLYGMSMIYGATGTLQIDEIARQLAYHAANKTVLLFGLVFVIAGLAFKVGVVPFHMWVPDVYQGAPTAVTLIVGSAPKLAAFVMAIRLLVGGMFLVNEYWQLVLLLMASFSIVLGNLTAIAQRNVKRMLAYSTISHMGFMLLALASGVIEGASVADLRFSVLNAYSAALFYTVTYVLMSLAAFGTLILLSRAGFDAEMLDDLKGLSRRSPWFAAVMLITMFSMAGVPFFVGFFAKFSVLEALIQADRIGVAVFAVLMSLIGAYYYLRVVKLMYFDEPVDSTPLVAPTGLRVMLSVNGVVIALAGIAPNSLMSICALALGYSL